MKLQKSWAHFLIKVLVVLDRASSPNTWIPEIIVYLQSDQIGEGWDRVSEDNKNDILF